MRYTCHYNTIHYEFSRSQQFLDGVQQKNFSYKLKLFKSKYYLKNV